MLCCVYQSRALFDLNCIHIFFNQIDEQHQMMGAIIKATPQDINHCPLPLCCISGPVKG
jgi:hypothetical protein